MCSQLQRKKEIPDCRNNRNLDKNGKTKFVWKFFMQNIGPKSGSIEFFYCFGKMLSLYPNIAASSSGYVELDERQIPVAFEFTLFYYCFCSFSSFCMHFDFDPVFVKVLSRICSSSLARRRRMPLCPLVSNRLKSNLFLLVSTMVTWSTEPTTNRTVRKHLAFACVSSTDRRANPI